MNKKNKRRIVWPALTLVDAITLFLLSYLAFLGFSSESLESKKTLYIIILMGTLYIIVRFLFVIIKDIMTVVVLIAIALSCIYETILGGIDLLVTNGPYSSHQYGSFFNPGPLGGYLAVCSSLMVAYAFSVKNKYLKNIVWFVVIAALVFMPSTYSRAAILAFMLSFTILALKYRAGRDFLKRHFKWLVPALVFLSIGAYFLKKPSADGRLFMSKICIHSIMNNGITGSGLGRYCGAYGEAQYDYFNKKVLTELDETNLSSLDSVGRLLADCPKNAFNEFLKMGVEAGPVAAILFIGLLISAMVISWKSGSIWHYGLIAFIIFACFSYPLQYWLFRSFLVIILAASSSLKEGYRLQSFVIVMSTSLLAMVFYLIKMYPQVHSIKEAEQSYKEIHFLYSFNNYNGVTSEHEVLFSYLKSDENFLFDYAKSLNTVGNYEKSDSILMLGTRISCEPMFWNLMGNNNFEMGRFREAEECYRHAFLMVPNRLYPLFLLTKLYYAEGDYERARSMAIIVMGFKPKIESTTTKKLREEIKDLINVSSTKYN